MTTMTDTPTVLSTATALYRDAIMRATLGQVEAGDFTPVLHHRLRTLYAQ